jgi:hypothetical protein
MDAVSDRPKRTMPNLDCTNVPSKFDTKTTLLTLGFAWLSGPSTSLDHVNRRLKYSKEQCQITGGKHFTSYVVSESFVLKEDLMIFKSVENDTDYVYTLADPSRTSSFWMIPVAAVADCKQFKRLTQDERNAITVKSTCEGIPIGQHLYEALTTHTPAPYILASATAHKRTHSAEPATEDGHQGKKAKQDSVSSDGDSGDLARYQTAMADLTSLKVPIEEVPPPSPGKVEHAEPQPAVYIKRMLSLVRKPVEMPQTRAQFLAFVTVNSLTRPDGRKAAAAASNTELKTRTDWQAALLKEKPTFHDTVAMMSNAQDVVMTAACALHAEDSARAAAERAKHDEEIANQKRALSDQVNVMRKVQNEADAKIAVLKKERDESVAKLQKELEAKQAQLATLSDEMKSLNEGKNGANMLADFCVDDDE